MCIRDSRNNGLSVKPENYELVYTAPLTEQDSLESIYTRFNINHPADFKGHSLSVSDIVVLQMCIRDSITSAPWSLKTSI